MRSDAPAEQVREVVSRFDLAGAIAPFTRCTVCNGPVRLVPKERVADRLLPRTRREHTEFRYCAGCDRVYWKGSHFARLSRRVQRLFPARDEPAGPNF